MIVTFESPSQEENLTPQQLSLLIAQRQRGDDVKYLIAPTPIELKGEDTSQHSCTTAKISPAKKNHLKANRQALKEKQRNNKDAELERRAKESQRQQRQEQKKEKLYGKVRARVFDPTAASDTPSISNCSRHPHGASHHSSPSRAMPFSSDCSTSNDQAYHIAFGRKVPIRSPAARPASSIDSVASNTSRHRSYGKVPTYITDRKAKIERQEAERRIKEENAPPAPGLVLLEESERLQTLKMLDDNEREARESLRNIPFSMNHQKAARLREAIEFRLKEIEDTRKIFSKDKVFVASGE